MTNISFNNPYLLFAFIPLILLLVVPFIIFVKRKRPNKIISLILHIIISALLVVSLADLKTTSYIVDSNVYILCDVSTSTIKSREKMDEYIEEYKDKITSNTSLGVICYGRNQELLVPLGEEIKSVSLSSCDPSSSNLEEALRYTLSIMKEDKKNHIIILSDGLEVDGDSKEYVKEIPDDIRIDAVYFETVYSNEDYEMLVESITGSKSTYLGVNEKLSFKIHSSYSDEANMRIYCDDVLIKESTLKVKKGINTFTFDPLTNESGKRTYRIEIQNNKDFNKENNIVYFHQEIVDKPNILYIYNDEVNSLSFYNYLKDQANITRLPQNRIRNTSVQYLCSFDEVVLNNVNLSTISDGENLASSLNTYVNEYGKTLITFGGENTYLNGGFYTSELNDMLPVNINPSDTKNETAVMILIDSSGSMGGRLDDAKVGAINCLNLLTENDYFGVATFASTTSVVWPISHPTSKNRILMEKKINSIKEGDGTVMGPGLDLAYEQLKRIDSKNKMILLLSDGMPSDANVLVEKCDKIAKNNIMVSTICISNSKNEIMMDMAEAGNGHCVAANTSSSIEQAMLSEVTDIIMETNIEKNIEVKKNIIKSPYLEGLNDELPSLNGFNYSKIKMGADNILSTSITLENGIDIEDAPLLAKWDYGNGKVISLMTDTLLKWSNNWESSVLPQLLKNIMINSLPKEHTVDDISFKYEIEAYVGSLNVSFSNPNVFDEVEYEVCSPTGKIETYSSILARGMYFSKINLDENGIYKVKVSRKNLNNLSFSSYDFIIIKNYSKEYNSFDESDNILLWELVDGRGILSNKVDDIVSLEQEDKISEKHYNIYFIIAALCLFIIDVIVRKFTMHDIIKIKKLFIKSLKKRK